MTLAVNIAQGGSNNVTMRNRIINGACVIDQRNAGASVTNVAGSVYTLDRWKTYGSQASKFTVQQNAGSVTPPSGYTNYLGVTSLSAYSVGTNEEFDIYQNIEGFNCADFGWGTANAKTVTLSFWVRSSLTGTFGGSLQNYGSTRSYVFSYTISSANTWTQVSITIAGDQSGTWLTNNSLGVSLLFGMGQGSGMSNTAGSWLTGNYNNVTGGTSVVGTNGATWYVTGVQLEAGTTASPFEYRQYGTELALCQRYYYQYVGDASGASGGYTWMFPIGPTSPAYRRGVVTNPVYMRAAPTVSGVTVRVNDTSTVSASAQYQTITNWSPQYTTGASTDYVACNAYTVSAEL